MSSTGQAEITALIQDAEFNALQNYCTTAAAALFAYHYFLTLDQEVVHFWGRKLTFARALFLANRYVPLITAFYVSPWWPLPTDLKVCAAVLYSQYILEFSQNGLWGAIACLRVYALRKQWATAVSPRSGNRVHRLWRTLPVLLTLVFALVPVVVDMVLLASYMWPALDPVCTLIEDIPTPLYEKFISYTSFVLSEALATLVTWIAASPWPNAYANAAPALPVSVIPLNEEKKTSIHDVLKKNGLAYLVVILVLNVFQAVNDVFGIIQPTLTILQISALLTFVSPLRSILLTHFYFCLKETSESLPSPVSGTLLHDLSLAGSGSAIARVGCSSESLPDGGCYV
ncbi:hypothetical protein BV20DRAFT_481771 [Pilatotrama ljubarskyi]|nr:hypothetical protein BV20DRAFT_481771 [Pilatotrama ljubarskyi]